MTFEEAKLLKEKIGETLTISDLIFNIVIAPKSPADFKDYSNNYRKVRHSEESAKHFARDNDYQIAGFNLNGGSIVYINQDYLEKKINLWEN